MPGPIRTRLACDRCHSQKLRCPKTPTSSVCTRCSKAGAACVFSPPGRSSSAQNGFPDLASVTPIRDDLGDGAPSGLVDGMALDWPFMYDGLSLDNLMGDVVTPNSSESLPSHATESSPSNPVDSGTGSLDSRTNGALKPESCFQKLAKVAAELDALLTAMPSGVIQHVPRDESLQRMVDSMSKVFDQKGTLERIFTSIQQLCDLYPEAIKTALGAKDDFTQPCAMDNCLHLAPVPPAMSPMEKRFEMEDSKPHVDLALANILLVTHSRVIDLLDEAFRCSLSCCKMTYSSPDRSEPDFDAPDIRIGSFVPPKASSALMQAALLKHLVSTLGRRLELFRDAVQALPAVSSDRKIQCLVMQVELLMEINEVRAQEIGGLAPALTQLEDLKKGTTH